MTRSKKRHQETGQGSSAPRSERDGRWAHAAQSLSRREKASQPDEHGGEGLDAHAIEPQPLVQAILDASCDAALLMDAGGIILAVNEPMAANLGAAPAKIVGRSFKNAGRDCVMQTSHRHLAQRVLQSGKPIESKGAHNGRLFQTRCCPVFSKSGRIEGIICFIRDITEERELIKALEKKDAALNELLRAGEKHKKELAESVVANIDKLIMPLIEDLRRRVDENDRKELDLLTEYLHEIASPFVACLSRPLSNLTLTEIRICELLRRGLSTSEIADRHHVSPATVRKHREQIRHKLGIQGKKIGLARHLDALSATSRDGLVQ